MGKACQIKKFVFMKQRNTVGRRQYHGKVVYMSKDNDIALIEVDTPPSENFTVAEICPEEIWDKMTLYDRLYLISCGVGTVPCVTRGTLASVDKDETEMGFTAQIIYGSSGGGIYNSDGQLIGIGNAVKMVHGHPIPHKALGVPLTSILKDIRESDLSFILDEYDEAAEEEEEEEEEVEPDDWGPDDWEYDENGFPKLPEIPEIEPKKKIWH